MQEKFKIFNELLSGMLFYRRIYMRIDRFTSTHYVEQYKNNNTFLLTIKTWYISISILILLFFILILKLDYLRNLSIEHPNRASPI